MSDTQGHAGSGADALFDAANNKPNNYSDGLAPLRDYAQSLESEVSRLRAELGEANKFIMWVASCAKNDILSTAQVADEIERLYATRPASPAERAKGEGA